MIKIISLLVISSFCLTLSVHEFHLSKSTVNYNEEEKAIQITMNMFIDDLELALSEYGADSLKVCTQHEKENAEDYIYSYILDRLEIVVDGQKVTPEFIGKEQSEDLAAVWCYLEVTGIDQIGNIEINNTIMTDLYDDQKNMTSIQKNRNRVKDILFTTEKTFQKFNLD